MTNSFYDTFREESMKDFIVTEEHEEVLTEGLKYFKISKKLYKLSDKLTQKAKRKNKPELINTAKKIAKLAHKFEDAEDLYEIGRKSEAKLKYKKLIKDYSELIKLLKKSETIDMLKAVGGLAITVATMVLPYMLLNKFFPSLSFGAVNTAAAKEVGMLDQAGLYLKRAGAFTLCGIPTKMVGGAIRNGTETYDDKIVNQVDKLLS